jgi:hypothetical protein
MPEVDRGVTNGGSAHAWTDLNSTKRLIFSIQDIIEKTLSQIFKNNLKSRLSSVLRSLTPYNRLGDKLICLHDFYMSHGRIATNKLIFNDVLYKRLKPRMKSFIHYVSSSLIKNFSNCS